jgi:hypothetical protein
VYNDTFSGTQWCTEVTFTANAAHQSLRLQGGAVMNCSLWNRPAVLGFDDSRFNKLNVQVGNLTLINFRVFNFGTVTNVYENVNGVYAIGGRFLNSNSNSYYVMIIKNCTVSNANQVSYQLYGYSDGFLYVSSYAGLLEITVSDSTFYKSDFKLSFIERFVIQRCLFYDVDIYRTFVRLYDIDLAEITDCVLSSAASNYQNGIRIQASSQHTFALLRNISIRGSGIVAILIDTNNVVMENIVFENVSYLSLLNIQSRNISLANSNFKLMNSINFLSVSPGCQIRISNCSFQNNSAVTLNFGKLSSGYFENMSVASNQNLEFIFNSGSSVVFSNSVFSRNVFYSKYLFDIKLAFLAIQNVSFTENFMNSFSLISVDGNVSSSDSSFDSSKSEDVGSGLYIILLPKAKLQISNSVFTLCYASSGDCIYLAPQTKSTVVNTSFKSCSATISHGGSIYLGTEASLSLINSTFKNCFAELNGGCIFADAKSRLIIEGSIFANGSSGNSGGQVFIAPNGILSCTNSMFSFGFAEFNGGSIYFDLNSIFSLLGCSFYASAAYLGGALYLNESQSALIASCFFNSCSAVDYGGAIYVFAGFFKKILLDLGEHFTVVCRSF